MSILHVLEGLFLGSDSDEEGDPVHTRGNADHSKPSRMRSGARSTSERFHTKNFCPSVVSAAEKILRHLDPRDKLTGIFKENTLVILQVRALLHQKERLDHVFSKIYIAEHPKLLQLRVLVEEQRQSSMIAMQFPMLKPDTDPLISKQIRLWLNDISNQLNGAEIEVGGITSQPNVVQASVVTKDLSEMVRVVKIIRGTKCRIVHWESSLHFQSSPSGYRDLELFCQLDSIGRVVQLRVHLKELYDIKLSMASQNFEANDWIRKFSLVHEMDAFNIIPADYQSRDILSKLVDVLNVSKVHSPTLIALRRCIMLQLGEFRRMETFAMKYLCKSYNKDCDLEAAVTLIESFKHQRNLKKLERAFQKAISLSESIYGAHHPRTVQLESQYGCCFYLQKKFGLAEESIKTVLEKRSAMYGQEHGATKRCVRQLALVFLLQHKYKEMNMLRRRYPTSCTSIDLRIPSKPRSCTPRSGDDSTLTHDVGKAVLRSEICPSGTCASPESCPVTLTA